jgi:hypothetical protein
VDCGDNSCASGICCNAQSCDAHGKPNMCMQ